MQESASDKARDPELEEVPGVWASLGGETAQDLSYKKRQFLFVGATIPQNGKKTVGAILKQWYPNATWVEGNKLHCTVPTVTHRFMVSVLSRVICSRRELKAVGATI